MRRWSLGGRNGTREEPDAVKARNRRRVVGGATVLLAAIVAFALMSTGVFAGKQPLTIAVTPTSTTAGSTGNAFTFKVTTSVQTAGQLSIVVPAGWTAPQASNSTLPGYVVIQKLTCASAGPFPTSITGSGPWTITIAYNCATNKNFSMTYGGTVAPSKVAAPTSPGFYEFTAQADFGTGFQRLASQPVITVNAPSVHLAVSGLPSTVGAGASNPFTVSARDSRNNVVTKYLGTVNLSSNDPSAMLPANYTFTAGDSGTHTFTPGATFVSTGSRTLTATDTSNAAINGSQAVTVGAGAATHFAVSGLASPSTAGVAQSVTVTAKDAFNNTATGYSGTVHFTSSDGAATLPANYGFSAGDAGSHTFSVTLRTVGSQDVTATDTANAAINGLQTITVNPGAATHFAVSAPASATAGVAQSVTVTAKDSSNNTATGYTGTAHFTSSDGAATLPADYHFSGADAGSHAVSVTLRTAGSRSVTATDTSNVSITGSDSVTVVPAAATHYAVNAPASATAGVAFSPSVTALDAFNNTATGYTGTVHFTAGDGAATLPADYSFSGADAGSHAFSVTLRTAGSQSVTATDTSNASITGSDSVTVTPAAATHYAVNAPASATAGAAFSATVIALDAFQNIATGYGGAVQFSSGDPQATVPGDSTLTGGSGTFSVTLRTAGSQSLTATDTVDSSITGDTSTAVNPAAASHLLVSGLADPSAPGDSQDVTVSAKDAFDNTATGYAGTVHFTSGDGTATLPSDYAFTGGDNGVHTFPGDVTLRSAGTQDVTATDTSDGSITGTETVTVGDTLYVATTGSNSNVGSQSAPLKTINAAVAKTGSLPGVLKLHVAEGSYGEGAGGVAVVDGLTISGGYAADWTQTGTATTIVGNGQSVFADGDTGVSIDHVTLAPLIGASVYGLRAINASSVTISNVAITTPAAPAGAPGPPGTDGFFGQQGQPGQSANDDCASPAGLGGPGGVLFTAGGKGGDANCSGGAPGDSGSGGGGGSQGSPGGCCSGFDGGTGGSGFFGGFGSSGNGGNQSTALAGVTWLGQSGTDGTSGGNGSGGGGGGGGGTFDCGFFCFAHPGGGGGGGGGAGQGGGGGHGAGPGGGSFGIYLWASTLTVSSTAFTIGKGGNGGAGGFWGDGGAGGPGGFGGGPSTTDAGFGGHGGFGGAGGHGGAGGGGVGGPSIGVFRGGGSTATIGAGNTFSLGGGGTGGSSAGGGSSPGAPGIATPLF
jgi:hypothetical protein